MLEKNNTSLHVAAYIARACKLCAMIPMLGNNKKRSSKAVIQHLIRKELHIWHSLTPPERQPKPQPQHSHNDRERNSEITLAEKGN